MLVSCWSAKGGSGTTVVAAALASVLGRRCDQGGLLVDASPATCPSCSEFPSPTVPASPNGSPPDQRCRLTPSPVWRCRSGPGSGSCLAGRRAFQDPDRVEVLAALLAGDPRDGGRRRGSGVGGARARAPRREAARVLAAVGDALPPRHPVVLSLGATGGPPAVPAVRASSCSSSPAGRWTGERSRTGSGSPVVAEVAIESQIARAADSGMLARRVPRSLERALRHAA